MRPQDSKAFYDDSSGGVPVVRIASKRRAVQGGGTGRTQRGRNATLRINSLPAGGRQLTAGRGNE